jgi:hypothetical protein
MNISKVDKTYKRLAAAIRDERIYVPVNIAVSSKVGNPDESQITNR